MKPLTQRVPYQKDDIEAFDYEMYFINGFEIALRGPRVPWHLYDDYHVAIGSAGVFGRFCQQPYVHQLNHMGFPTVNLGFTGTRPEHYLQGTVLDEIMGGAKILLIEFMSARGYPTRFYRPDDLWRNKGVYIDPEGVESETLFVDRVWEAALRDYGEAVVVEEIENSRATYMEEMQRIIRENGEQIVFLWIGQRDPDYTMSGTKFIEFSGWFPHFVNKDMRDALIAMARDAKGDENVRVCEVISKEGLPQPIYSRHTGEPVACMPPFKNPSKNIYYPSPQMHDMAAKQLLSAFRELSGQ